VEGILRTVEQAGVERFHLVGFSGGGAVSLAFAAKYPQRLRSLALIEPAWIGNDGWTAEDKADFAELDRIMGLPEAERMAPFRSWQLRSGAEPPSPPAPAGPPPAWMAKRPAGLEAFDRAFKAYALDRERFRSFHQPVYYAYGSLGRPFYERNAATLGRLFTNFRVEVYEGLWHFNPPHRAEPDRFAKALIGFWGQAPD
jgi:pimeloyl-ACP methyl ester carboxylesterase